MTASVANRTITPDRILLNLREGGKRGIVECVFLKQFYVSLTVGRDEKTERTTSEQQRKTYIQ